MHRQRLATLPGIFSGSTSSSGWPHGQTGLPVARMNVENDKALRKIFEHAPCESESGASKASRPVEHV